MKKLIALLFLCLMVGSAVFGADATKFDSAVTVTGVLTAPSLSVPIISSTALNFSGLVTASASIDTANYTTLISIGGVTYNMLLQK